MSAERVERRLAAILAADVAGYSRLMGRDEAGTLARLMAHRRTLIDPNIEEHKGRIVKTTGDGMLIEFPSVVEAVACAVEVQRGMLLRNADAAEDQRIELRVGINVGDVIVEGDDLYGDGVNVAARLEALAEPGRICISGVVHEQVQDRLDLAYDDLGVRRVKNIARPLHVYCIAVGAGPTTPFIDPLTVPDKPSLAVLPFANMSSDPEQEFLADGIAEDIITALSRYPSLFVIARNSSFTYKGRAVDVKQIGRDLGVRYVLEGSLRKSGNRVRVTAQLVEADSGNHVWAERYDRDLADIFEVQDEIAEAVTIAVAPAVAEAERHRAMRKPPENLDAWAAYQRGLWHLGKVTPEDNSCAQRYFEQAIDLDPGFAGGYTGLALVEFYNAAVFAQLSLPEMQSVFEGLARRAVALDSGNAEARARLSVALALRGDHEGGRAEAERALAICPSHPDGHAALGIALTYSGRPREGVAAFETSLRLDPCDPALWLRMQQVATGRYLAGDYEGAITAAKRTVRSYPDYPLIYRWLAAALGQAGRTREAGEALQKALAFPSFDLYVNQRPAWMRPEDHVHMLDGLRKAGWEGP